MNALTETQAKKIDLIAEIAGGHEGSIEHAMTLLDIASQQGASSIKFQIYVADDLCIRSHGDYEIFKSLEFLDSEWLLIQKRARHLGLKLYVDVFGFESLRIAKLLKVDGIKIHPSDIGNVQFIVEVSKETNLLFLGVGGRKRIEIFEVISSLRKGGYNGNIVIVTGYQLFPTPEDQHSLQEISHFKNVYTDFDVKVCVADHIDGSLTSAIIFPIAAIGAGATFVEKHLTSDRSQEFEDFEAALNPSEFGQLSAYIDSVEKINSPFPQWSMMREQYRYKTIKRPVANEDIEVGEMLLNEKINFLRTSSELNTLPDSAFQNKKVMNKILKGQELRSENFRSKMAILITSRMQSTRLPGKALLEFNGQPALEILIKNLKNVCHVDDIILCTTTADEDQQLVDLADRNSIKSFRGHSFNIAKRLHDACIEHEVDSFVRVTADDLLRDIDLIQIAVESHINNNSDYTYFTGCMLGLDSEVISFRAIKLILDRAEDVDSSEYLSWYLDDESLFNVNPIVANSKYDGSYQFSLDTQEDFALFTKIYEKFNPLETIDVEELKYYLEEIGHPKNSPDLSRTKLVRAAINTALKV